MKILVTGATGFIGNHITKKLIEDGHTCNIVVRDKEKAIILFGNSVSYTLFAKENGRFEQSIKEFSPDVVMHLASYLSSADDKETISKLIDANIVFTAYLLNAVKEVKLKWFINTGSFSEYYYNDGKLDPAYIYAATKIGARALLEYYAHAYNFNYVNAVLYTVYGPGDRNKKIIDYIIDSLTSTNLIGMTEGGQCLDFVHVSDVVDFYLGLVNGIANNKSINQEYHVGTGVGTKIRQLASIIEGLTGLKANINWGERQYRVRDVMHSVAPNYRCLKELDWRPMIHIEEGLREILNAKGLACKSLLMGGKLN